MDRKKDVSSLLWGLVGAGVGFFGLLCFNSYLLMSLPMGMRMMTMIPAYWLIGIAPACVAVRRKIRLSDMGFSRENLGRQIFIGLLITLAMSAVLTLLPHLLGYGQYFSSGKNYIYAWQFAYELAYCLLAVGLTEEFVFRGFVYERLAKICGSEGLLSSGHRCFSGFFIWQGGALYRCL